MFKSDKSKTNYLEKKALENRKKAFCILKVSEIKLKTYNSRLKITNFCMDYIITDYVNCNKEHHKLAFRSVTGEHFAK